MEKFAAYFLAFVFFVFFCFMIFFIPLLIEELSKASERRKFRLALSKAINSDSLSWKQVRVLADRYHLSQGALAQCLIRLIAGSLEEKEGLTTQQVASFERHYDQVQKDEPFDGIPNDVRFHLERVREKLGESDDLLRPLAKQLQDLSARNRTKERNMWIVSVLSLLVGIIGAIVGALHLLDQPKPLIQSKAEAPLAQESAASRVAAEQNIESSKRK